MTSLKSFLGPTPIPEEGGRPWEVVDPGQVQAGSHWSRVGYKEPPPPPSVLMERILRITIARAPQKGSVQGFQDGVQGPPFPARRRVLRVSWGLCPRGGNEQPESTLLEGGLSPPLEPEKF